MTSRDEAVKVGADVLSTRLDDHEARNYARSIADELRDQGLIVWADEHDSTVAALEGMRRRIVFMEKELRRQDAAR